MTRMQMAGLGLCLLVWIWCGWLWFRPGGLWFLRSVVPPNPIPESELHEYDAIHMPKSGQCPPGFTVAPDLFEKGGMRYAGCVRSGYAGPGKLDYLLPGESVIITIPLRVEDGKGKG